MDAFELTIELGNAAMRAPEHVADALRGVVTALDGGSTGGRIRDENGNTVGRWEMPPVATEDEYDDELVDRAADYCPEIADLTDTQRARLATALRDTGVTEAWNISARADVEPALAEIVRD